jgi:hypothetical protein
MEAEAAAALLARYAPRLRAGGRVFRHDEFALVARKPGAAR